MSDTIKCKHTTLAEIVHHRARTNGDQTAYIFLADGAQGAHPMTWAQLDQSAVAIADCLRAKGAAGQPVLLALPSGLGFVKALFACWYAGAIAVPVSLPRHQRVKHRLESIISDAGARFAMGTCETKMRVCGESAANSLTWIDVEKIGSASPASSVPDKPQDLALLQYTSGSTGAPRGVMVTHANLMHNSALIAEACGHGSGQTIAGWLPLFHDMGLIGLILQAAFSGARCVFMSPERFLMRPRLWLQMISDYGACSSPAPNFAYDLCVDKIDPTQKTGLNLSSWRNALNGSEPVRASTLERFAASFESCGFNRRAFFPCYGLAESTLFVTGPDESRRLIRRSTSGTLIAPGDQGGHVGCGRAFGDTTVEIVDPDSTLPAGAGKVGEIWVKSGSVTSGYWKNPQASAAMFNASIVRGTDLDIDSGGWLRTGDLGFLANGELFITGRLRELIIIAGRNLFPVDLERTAEAADPSIAASGAAAFSVDIDGVERLVIAVELKREYSSPARGEAALSVDPDAVCQQVRSAVAAEHDVSVNEVVLLRSGGLMRTTSGKISRLKTRDAFLDQTLEQIEGAICADSRA